MKFPVFFGWIVEGDVMGTTLTSLARGGVLPAEKFCEQQCMTVSSGRRKVRPHHL